MFQNMAISVGTLGNTNGAENSIDDGDPAASASDTQGLLGQISGLFGGLFGGGAENGAQVAGGNDIGGGNDGGFGLFDDDEMI